VHPLAITPSGHNSGVPQIRQVPGNLRLRLIQDLNEIANADFLVSHQVQEPQPGIVSKCLKESLNIESFLSYYHVAIIFALTHVSWQKYIRFSRYMGGAMTEQLLKSVRSKYGAVAESTLSGKDAGVKAVAEAFGYSAAELTSIPAEANMGLSCGNPTAIASIRPGEVVVDLGSGGGMDVFLASPLVGPSGKVIGIDMTQEMIERARTNAQNGGYLNVEFYLGTIDHLPLADGSVDCVISNCVINLAPDKAAVFHEIARVLKPGGRLAVSDIALKAELPAAVAQSMAAYVGCIGGAIKIDDYRQGLLAAGFEHVEIVDSGADLNSYAKVENQAGCCSPVTAPANDSTVLGDSCCSANAPTSTSLHEDLTKLLAEYDVNAAAASVKVYAVKPLQRDQERCCGPTCCIGTAAV
jgi:SAM-dependent methyltransferase